MGRRISDETKRKRGWGTGAGPDWKPWLTRPEMTGGAGLKSNVPDPKSGRPVQTMSMAERKVYLSLRWNDGAEEICEQWPMDPELTYRIALEVTDSPAIYKRKVLTTDFVVTDRDGRPVKALSVKKNRDEFFRENDGLDRRLARMRIEELYWKLEGVPWEQVYGDEVDQNLYRNLNLVFRFYRESLWQNPAQMAAWLIATKRVAVDMESGPLRFTTEFCLEVIRRGGMEWN